MKKTTHKNPASNTNTIPNISIESAQLVFRNFSGKAGIFNTAGKRNFCVLIDEKNAKELEKFGWNIKYLKPRNEDELPQAYLQVTVNFKSKIPPKIVLITSYNKATITEAEVNILDWAEYSNVDLIIRPYNWAWETKGGSSEGISAYLKTLYMTIVEDEFERKYRTIPDSAKNSIRNDE